MARPALVGGYQQGESSAEAPASKSVEPGAFGGDHVRMTSTGSTPSDATSRLASLTRKPDRAADRELLDALARTFVESGYDLRALVRTVATSHAYGVASSTVPVPCRSTYTDSGSAMPIA